VTILTLLLLVTTLKKQENNNGSATAALLRSAPVLSKMKLERDVLLVHFTGEEFPGDCLGARYFVSTLLQNKQDITGLVLMDMIGWKDPLSGGVFQVNAGNSKESVELARVAMSASSVAPSLDPIFRSRFDKKSYLYNTDGIIFSEAGYPVILLNEHINRFENIDRKHYHETTDTASNMDIEYASGITKVAIETTARLAGAKK
jgi:hypothetical protein